MKSIVFLKPIFMFSIITFIFSPREVGSVPSIKGEKIRKPAVAGAFYPASAGQIDKQIKNFLQNVHEQAPKGPKRRRARRARHSQFSTRRNNPERMPSPRQSENPLVSVVPRARIEHDMPGVVKKNIRRFSPGTFRRVPHAVRRASAWVVIPLAAAGRASARSGSHAPPQTNHRPIAGGTACRR